MEIVILAGAEANLFDAWRAYEEWLPGYGDRFDEAFREATAQLSNNPFSARASPVNFGDSYFVGSDRESSIACTGNESLSRRFWTCARILRRS